MNGLEKKSKTDIALACAGGIFSVESSLPVPATILTPPVMLAWKEYECPIYEASTYI